MKKLLGIGLAVSVVLSLAADQASARGGGGRNGGGRQTSQGRMGSAPISLWAFECRDATAAKGHAVPLPIRTERLGKSESWYAATNAGTNAAGPAKRTRRPQQPERRDAAAPGRVVHRPGRLRKTGRQVAAGNASTFGPG